MAAHTLLSQTDSKSLQNMLTADDPQVPLQSCKRLMLVHLMHLFDAVWQVRLYNEYLFRRALRLMSLNACQPVFDVLKGMDSKCWRQLAHIRRALTEDPPAPVLCSAKCIAQNAECCIRLHPVLASLIPCLILLCLCTHNAWCCCVCTHTQIPRKCKKKYQVNKLHVFLA